MPPSLPFPAGAPLLVGTVLTPAGLERLAGPLHDPDLVEIRADALLQQGFGAEKIAAALARRTLPVLLTCRIPAEGGLRAWKKGERAALFAALLPHVEAVDVELASATELKGVLAAARKARKKIVLSAHAIRKPAPPATLRRWVSALRKARPDIAKIAARTDAPEQVRALARTLLLESETKGSPTRWAVMGLGRHGAASRQAFALLGTALLYGYLDEPAAPGQPSVGELAGFLKILRS